MYEIVLLISVVPFHVLTPRFLYIGIISPFVLVLI